MRNKHDSVVERKLCFSFFSACIAFDCVLHSISEQVVQKRRKYKMAKHYQVRYTVGDKTVAHEHYTEKGAKSDAKSLSKVIGNAMLGEIDTAEDGTVSLVRVWEYAGGEMGKPIKREGPPTEVEVIKTVEDTKGSEVPVEKKPKAPKKTDEEKIAEIKLAAEEQLAQIAAGTYVIPTRGRKASTEGGATTTRKPKVESDKIAKLVESLKVSEDTAKLIAAVGLNSSSRRTKVAVPIFEAGGPIMASAIVAQLNEAEEKKFDMKEVVLFALHLNYLFSRENLPYRVSSKEKGDDNRLYLVPIQIDDGDEETTSEVA